MVYIPGFLVNKVYERGSLQNTEDGFRFSFMNTMTPLKISGMRDVIITIDAETLIPQEDVKLVLGDQTFEISSEPLTELVEFAKNSKLDIHVKGEALSEGKHVIKISFITNEYGGVSLKVRDFIGEHEKASIWNKLKRKISKKGGIPKRRPIIIEGMLGGVPLDPDFSRIEAVLRREVPDRVPLFEAEIEIPIKEWFLGREITTAEDEVEFYIRAGYDFVPVVPPFFTPRLMRTAEGDERTWITESEGIIKTMEDIENFPWPDPDQVDFSSFHDIAELLPPAKKLVTMPKLGAVLMSDDLAHVGGTFVNPKVYRKYVFPWYAKIGNVLGAAGIPFIFHSDGNFMSVFNDLYDCGVKAIHPIEPQAMDIVSVKKEYGSKFAIFGNIDLDYTLTRGTTDEVVTKVKHRIKELAPGGGWGLAASNSVPDYVKPENFKAMIEATKKYGKYPINIK